MGLAVYVYVRTYYVRIKVESSWGSNNAFARSAGYYVIITTRSSISTPLLHPSTYTLLAWPPKERMRRWAVDI